MLPDVYNSLQADFTFGETPGRTHRIDFKTQTIKGFVDGIEAVKQTIFCILNSERTKYEIYSWNYGVEIERLIGRQKELIYAKIQNTVTDALLQDDRIKAVYDFTFEDERGKTQVTFRATTSEGEIETGWTFDV